MPNADRRMPASIVKVCGITSAAEAIAAVQAGANALGFNFYPKSPRYLTLEAARQIAQAVTSPYLRIGVFVNPTEEELAEAASTVPLDILQLHGRNLPLHLAASYRVWQAIPANHLSGLYPNTLHPDVLNLAELNPDVEAYLLDTPTPLFGGSGQHFDWTLAAGFPRRAIVAGGLDASNVAAAILSAHPWGVDACSRIESQPGRKDPRSVAAFVQAALAAFARQHTPALPQELTQ